MKDKYIVNEFEADTRLDQLLSQILDDYSRSTIQTWIKEGKVLINGNTSKSNYRLKNEDEITYEIQEEDVSLVAMDIPLDIVYEDDDIMVINKPKGLIVHPTASTLNQPTLVHALLAHTDKLSDLNGELRPGIVHRLDKDTSGLLLVAKTNEAHAKLVEDLKERNISREYMALVHHPFAHEHALVDAPIGRDTRNRQRMCVTDVNSKDAKTHFYLVENFKDYSLLRCKLETGRTHQIRVHAHYIEHPIVGDKTYGYRKTLDLDGQALHAFRIGFKHPIRGEEMVFESDMPQNMQEAIEEIRRND